MSADRCDLRAPRPAGAPAPRVGPPADIDNFKGGVPDGPLVPGLALGLFSLLAAAGVVILAACAMPAIALCAILLVEWTLG